MSKYKFDIFLSYRRDPQTLQWIDRHFLPLLKFRLGLELDEEPEISVDKQIETGLDWPTDLATRLASSRVLLALLSRNYLHSKWCTLEMSQMLARESATGRRTPENPRGLVIPAIIHDGDDLPPSLRRIQAFDIRDCYNVRMSQDSPRAEKLDEVLTREAPAIAAAVRAAPEWREAWSSDAVEGFYQTFYRGAPPVQTVLPALA